MGENRYSGMNVRIKPPKEGGIFVAKSRFNSSLKASVVKESGKTDERCFYLSDAEAKFPKLSTDNAFKKYIESLFEGESVRVTKITISPDVRDLLKKKS